MFEEMLNKAMTDILHRYNFFFSHIYLFCKLSSHGLQCPSIFIIYKTISL